VSDHEDDHPLRPSLGETELQLQSALDEVCEDTVIENVDTGELIRIEETLAIASDAAKQAISLRKKIRSDLSDSADQPS
jgi:hypothetical protein